MPTPEVYVFRVLLNRKLYREIEIAGSKTLCDLAEAIVAAYGFDFDHAFGFFSNLTRNIYASPVKYELFADMGEPGSRSVKRTKIAGAFPSVGAQMTFLFDYGDDWQFRTVLVGKNKKQAGIRYPRIVKTVGDAPEQYPEVDEE